jgi:hypothetical protein
MAVRLQERAPRVRCYACGSAQISQVCQYCGRAGCRSHMYRPSALASRLFGREGRGLGLDKLPSYHCRGCGHPATATGLAAMAAGIAAALAGLILLRLGLAPLGLALVVLGAGTVVGADLYVRHLGAQARAGLPLPVLPKIDDLRVRETLHARITLDPEGRYDAQLSPVDGELAADLTFGRPDRDRLERYLRRRSGPAADRDLSAADVEFSAGFLVLQGRAGLDTSGGFPGQVIYLNGRTGDHPVFGAGDHQISSPWQITLPYKLPDVPQVLRSGPVWVTPSIVARSDQRTLELDIQWAELGLPGAPLVLDRVESLRLLVPASWGRVERASDGATVGIAGEGDGEGEGEGDDPDQLLRSIEWRHLSPADERRQQRRLAFTIRFEERIDLAQVLRGRLDLGLKGALSGLEGLQFFNPLGARRGHFSGAQIDTRIEAGFELSLASLRYQAVRLVPDPNSWPGDRGESDEFRGLRPDDEAAIELTNAMSDDGYYVKRVVESPPRAGGGAGGRAGLVHRHWDIAGRRYDGVYPIDVHVILTGEEVPRTCSRPAGSMTRVWITAQGACADGDMRDRVEQEWTALRKLTAKSLGALADRARPRELLPPPYAAAPVGDAGDPVGHAGAGRNHRLLRRLGMLDEALLEGRISDERYAEMRSRAEAELGDGWAEQGLN